MVLGFPEAAEGVVLVRDGSVVADFGDFSSGAVVLVVGGAAHWVDVADELAAFVDVLVFFLVGAFFNELA